MYVGLCRERLVETVCEGLVVELRPRRRSPGFSRCAAGNRLKPGLLGRCPVYLGNL